jgi:hypothetical protein
MNRRFGGTYGLHLQGKNIRERGISVSRWLQTGAHAGSSLTDIFTLKMEAICSSETSVHTISTWQHIPEDDILQITLNHSKNYIQPEFQKTGVSLLSQFQGF